MIKKIKLSLNVLLIILSIIMMYLLINSYLTKDYISPEDMPFYEYLLKQIY